MQTKKRGCGMRKKGGMYLVTPLSERGQPVEAFLVCPPQKLAFDVPAQGMMPIWFGNTLHLIDWVGREYYPNVTDFVEEVAYLGISRRVPVSMGTNIVEAPDGSKMTVLEALSSQSRILSVHARGYINNLEDYASLAPWVCPQHREGHGHANTMCVGAYAVDVEPQQEDNPEGPGELFSRNMPSLSYLATQRPDVPKAYSPAIFAAWPIGKIEVVHGENGEHEPVVQMLETLKLKFNWTVEQQ